MAAIPNESERRNRPRYPGPTMEYFLRLWKPKPSEGSTFLKDCLVELREQNTSAYFVSFYEDMFPLIATLSQDLEEDFIPFLPRVVNSLVILLDNGGQKDPEIIEQIFKSWFKIMITLKVYLKNDIEGILRDTLELRCYPNDIVSAKTANSMSPLWRFARPSQLGRGIKMILSEVAEQPERAAIVGFLYYDMTVMQQKRS